MILNQSMTFRAPLVFGVAFYLAWGVGQTSHAQGTAPAGFTIPDNTRSPDQRFGVLVPHEQRYKAGEKNKLVEISTGRVLATIVGVVGIERMNNGGVDPTRWASDNSLLLWQVEGKWSPRTLVFIKLTDGEVQWQLDLIKSAEEEIFARARKAAPENYMAAKTQKMSNGAPWANNFIVMVKTDGEGGRSVSLPLSVHVTLECNPKPIPDYPENARLDANLEAKVGEDGKFKVTAFKLLR